MIFNVTYHHVSQLSHTGDYNLRLEFAAVSATIVDIGLHGSSLIKVEGDFSLSFQNSSSACGK